MYGRIHSGHIQTSTFFLQKCWWRKCLGWFWWHWRPQTRSWLPRAQRSSPLSLPGLQTSERSLHLFWAKLFSTCSARLWCRAFLCCLKGRNSKNIIWGRLTGYSQEAGETRQRGEIGCLCILSDPKGNVCHEVACLRFSWLFTKRRGVVYLAAVIHAQQIPWLQNKGGFFLLLFFVMLSIIQIINS